MEELEQRLPEEKAAAEQLAAGREEARTRRNGLREKAEQAKEKLRNSMSCRIRQRSAWSRRKQN